MTQNSETDTLKSELIGLFHYIQRVKEEIAAISRPADSDYHFETMSEQLTAIVAATEKATNAIMEKAEKCNETVHKVRPHVKGDKKANKLLDSISDDTQEIFEACSFQDITGQRVNKITKSLGYVEERVNSIVSIWGASALDEVKIEGIAKTEDEKLLNGPQLEGKGLSQADIDALFD